MIGHRLTILASHEEKLRSWLTGHPDGHERGALVLFRKFDRPVEGLPLSIRFVAVDVVQMDEDWILDSSPVHLRINLRKMTEIYLRCENEKLEVGFAHNHPNGCLEFSSKDDVNETNILRGLSGCNGLDTFLVSLLFAEGKWKARVRRGTSPRDLEAVRHVAILGSGLDVHIEAGCLSTSEVWNRQEAAFGKPFNAKLQSLRVLVLGGGGTGSGVATVAARGGVGELILVDGDVLDATNQNRVRGFQAQDVGHNKAKRLAHFINGIGLPTKVISIEHFIHESPEAIDALSSVDVVIGCTDDIAGRDIINQALYYYGLVLIDTGLTGKIDVDEDGHPYLRDHRGRVSCILPEYGACLRCQGVVTEDKLKYERALKSNPMLAELDAETLLREHYLVGGGEQAPGVGPFTSATADNAVATLFDLLRRFRKVPGDLRQDNVWIDFVHMTIHSNTPKSDTDCFCCGNRSILLKAEEGFRLDMPGLGRLK